MDDPYLCQCGAKMVKRSCRLDREAALLVRYLTCPACGGKRQLLVKPEEVVATLYLQRIQQPLRKRQRQIPRAAVENKERPKAHDPSPKAR